MLQTKSFPVYFTLLILYDIFGCSSLELLRFYSLKTGSLGLFTNTRFPGETNKNQNCEQTLNIRISYLHVRNTGQNPPSVRAVKIACGAVQSYQ